MRLNIGIIGIGNAGGQVAALGKKEGFAALAVNVSEDDTKSLEGIDTLIIGNSMGSGKNRALAKKYGKESIKDMMKQEIFSKFINSCQVVIIVYSVGGGSGSALGPMTTAVLKSTYNNPEESKRIRFINIGILPALSETLQGQENMMACIRELVSYDSCYGLYDNDRYVGMPVHEMMKTVNREIIEDIKVIRGDYNLLTEYNQIDAMDMLNVMSFNGMFRIASAVGFQEKDLDKQSIEDMIIKNLNSSSGCEIERDHAGKCMAPIVNIRQEVSGSFTAALPKLHELVGECPAGFEHYYLIGQEEEHLKNRVHVIMTGLSVPDDRLKKAVQRIEEAKASLSQKKESSVLAGYDNGTNFVGDANADNKSDSIDSILDKF